MDKYQVECLRTGDLIQLKKVISVELVKRRKATNQKKRLDFIDNLQPINPPTKAEIESYNSLNIVSIPGHMRRKHGTVSRYLPALINQDWSNIYNGGNTEPKYYVYAHVDPSGNIFVSSKDGGGNYGGTPFYIGKGVGDRAYDLKRNQGHGKIIQEVLSKGFSSERIVKILFSDLSEAKAFEIEAKLIYFFGSIYGRTPKTKKIATLYNLDFPKIPDFVGVMKEYPVKEQNKAKEDDES